MFFKKVTEYFHTSDIINIVIYFQTCVTFKETSFFPSSEGFSHFLHLDCFVVDHGVQQASTSSLLETPERKLISSDDFLVMRFTSR